MRTSGELRAGFRAFFESKGHKFHPSASLVPRADDRSTLLTTAGMQPLMPYFLGREQPPAPLLTTVQKCFRTPDIDDVGLDGYHLTFFEMLGNFSFGQYFKEGAIELAWEFVFDHLKLDPERFWVTVFEGDAQLGLGEDEVALRRWEEIGQPPERIVLLPATENFWSVGGPGPCGPDTEMYYDRGEEVGCGEPDCKPSCTRCERFLEFWNLVFMEFELDSDGKLTPLPKQNVDTGMGIERTSAILQNVMTVYETDIYQAIMRWIADESGVAYGDSPEATKAHRILADHGRGMTFLAADGVTPSNEGRGYVMRRVIRRAVQQAQRVGLEPPYLARLSDVVIREMGEGYPELEAHRAEIHRILSAEEERFGETLARGMRLFEEIAAHHGDITGEDAFRLHDTYGFPLELTQELARERGLGVNDEEFTRLMEQQRERSRAAISRDDRRAAEFATAAGFKSDFVGYEKTDVLTQLGALECIDERLYLAKLRESPFYPAGGGQVGDIGWLESDGDPSVRMTVRDAYRLEDDQALLLEGEGLSEGDRVRAVVPWNVRFPTMANHTATHLLHKALQDVLGEHVRQAGSAVRPDKLRFDFTHGAQLTAEERAEIERRVNEKIFENLPVHAFVTPIDEARKLGAMMLFGEKYGDLVRVVEIPGYSRELCGGTHVRWTAEIGAFVILTEGSVGAGARRIEAVTSAEAYAYLHGRLREAEELRAALERTRRESKKKPSQTPPEADVRVFREGEQDGVNLLVGEVDAVGADELLAISDRLKQERKPAAVFLGAKEDGRVHLVANFDKSLEQRLDAVKVIRTAAALIGGGGGGRATMARAGGRDAQNLPRALETAWQSLTESLK
ncbi:MAG TPA: alanine--tRNA ligase [Gaiellaceae bacterium]|nr:alanine--tRNA ligase [Gaiellaceae bacterium]